MNNLFEFQNNLLKSVNNHFFRFLYDKVDLKQRLISIKGLRGSGKTTLLLQLIKYKLGVSDKILYVTADHPYFYSNSLFNLASEFYNLGGKYLFIDEVHKYVNWSRELKLIYDGFPEMKVIFTASSALDIYKGESDLSRRVKPYDLPGLSFREYLNLLDRKKFTPFSLQDILKHSQKISNEIISELNKPLYQFNKYLKKGYLPFTAEETEDSYLEKIYNVISITLTSDLALSYQLTSSDVIKIKKLLGIIAGSVPFSPNVSDLARKMEISRDYIKNYFVNLTEAKMINTLGPRLKKTGALQKPGKIFLENTNLSYALTEKPDTGNLRETFFLNQIKNSKLKIYSHTSADFMINDDLFFEIGRKNKDTGQIKNLKNSYLVLDGIETGFKNRIPLYLFGFLY
ncbi:MAG TPA: AAA family ATPase [Bacteroidetes bacterium]|nr:AAA family ATPase [Bacteroidota bacterium]